MTRRIAAGLAAVALALGAGGAPAVEIGSVGAVNPLTTGEQPAAAARQLTMADRVVTNERIVAGPDGLAQLMFLDQSTLTVGPDSEVVLDRFVYDPDADAGEVALTLAKGALRFIGGRTTKATDARIAAPGGVIGLRGGMLAVDTAGDRTRVVLLAGEYAVVRSAGAELTLSRPGAFAIIENRLELGPDLRFGGVMSASEAAGLMAGFTSAGDGGDRGRGATQPPGAAMAAGAPRASIVSTLGETPPSALPQSDVIAGRVVEVETQGTLFSDPAAVVADTVRFVDVGSAGELRGQLQWRDTADLDLRLVVPESAVPAFSGREVSLDTPLLGLVGGAVARLDADAQGAVPTLPPDLRVENIAVTDGPVPPGVYVFFVDASVLPTEGSSYRLNVSADGGRTRVSETGRLTPPSGSDPGIVTSPGLAVTAGSPRRPTR
jgi:hypothetical protein